MSFPQARPFGRVLAPTTGLMGQFVITVPHAPFGPRPGAADNVVFFAEIDVIREHQPAWADTAVRVLKARGGNHIMTGPIWANGYGGQYPKTNWLGRVDQFVDFWRWATEQHGIALSLVVGPDNAPYYNDHARTFDMAAMERDLTPFYTDLQLRVGPLPRVITQWEQWQWMKDSAPFLDWMTRVFPQSERIYHNFIDHLGPGESYEGGPTEAELMHHVVKHGIGSYLYQGPPRGWYRGALNRDGRDEAGQTAYDLADLVRRLHHGYAGWPMRTPDGKPLIVRLGERHAYGRYNNWYGDDEGAAVYANAMAVPGVLECWDGLPKVTA